MSLKIRLRPEAEDDLYDAAAWYESQQAGLGHRFLDEVLDILDSLISSPLMYPLVYRSTRRAILNRFPFGVYFRIEPGEIVVVAVVHGSRHPRHWQRR